MTTITTPSAKIQSKVAKRANALVSKYGRKNAFIMALAAEKLIAQMQGDAPVAFEFIKDDGSNRKAIGTIEKTYVSEFWVPKGHTHKNADVVRFFDVEINQWRSFRIDRLKTA